MAVNQIFAGVKTGVGNLMSKIQNFIRGDEDYEGSYQEAVNPYQTNLNRQAYFAHQQAQAAPVVQNVQAAAEEETGKVRRRFENTRGQVLQPDFQQHAQQVAAKAEPKPVETAAMETEPAPHEPQHMYVVSATSMDDCYATISLLRQKNLVVFDMERLKPEEQKVQVDFMDGACCALGCSMTMVSQKGVYVLSPNDLVIHYNEGARNNNRGVPVGGFSRMNNANYQPRYNFRSTMNPPQGNAWSYTQQQPIQEYRGGYTEQLVQAPQAPVQNAFQPAMNGVAQNQF